MNLSQIPQVPLRTGEMLPKFTARIMVRKCPALPTVPCIVDSLEDYHEGLRAPPRGRPAGAQATGPDARAQITRTLKSAIRGMGEDGGRGDLGRMQLVRPHPPGDLSNAETRFPKGLSIEGSRRKEPAPGRREPEMSGPMIYAVPGGLLPCYPAPGTRTLPRRV